MAAGSLAKTLHDELSCFLCHEYFTEPVSIDCGHSFCQICITQSWENWGSDYSCPRCGEVSLKRKLRPNRDLGNVVEIAKRMKVEMAENRTGEKKCEIHQEPLELFCKDEQMLICATCKESKDLAAHVFVPVEEAVRDYKEQLKTQLQAWREKREKAFSVHAEEKKRYQEFQEDVNTEKQKIVSKFEEIQTFLKQEEKNMLDQLEELIKEEEKFVNKLLGDIYLSDMLIREIEEKSQQPPSAFLQNIGETLNRCQVEFQEQDVCSELEEKLHAFSKKYHILQHTLQAFTDDLPQQLQVKWVNVTLDPETAYPLLKVSGNRKNLTYTWDRCNEIDYPQRFSSSSCVLGCEGFTKGKHYWEVKVSHENEWAVGVAKESVKRKERLGLTSDEGIWALKKMHNAFTAGTHTIYYVVKSPMTVGVYLDYERNRVLFFDTVKGHVLYIYPASFMGEKIRPFFWLANQRDGCFQLCY